MRAWDERVCLEYASVGFLGTNQPDVVGNVCSRKGMGMCRMFYFRISTSHLGKNIVSCSGGNVFFQIL